MSGKSIEEYQKMSIRELREEIDIINEKEKIMKKSGLGITKEVLAQGIFQYYQDKKVIDNLKLKNISSPRKKDLNILINTDPIPVKETHEVLPFFGAETGEPQQVFSNFYLIDFNLDGVNFTSAEQAMMYSKAKFFKDEEIAEKILQQKNPKRVKALGRKVKNYDDEKWNSARYNIVKKIVKAKFEQNPDLLNYLKSTKNNILVEASPYDKIWGAGISSKDKKINQPEKWLGQNLLGKILMEIRDEN